MKCTSVFLDMAVFGAKLLTFIRLKKGSYGSPFWAPLPAFLLKSISLLGSTQKYNNKIYMILEMACVINFGITGNEMQIRFLKLSLFRTKILPIIRNKNKQAAMATT
jgi:hypothetical protein